VSKAYLNDSNLSSKLGAFGSQKARSSSFSDANSKPITEIGSFTSLELMKISLVIKNLGFVCNSFTSFPAFSYNLTIT
jgi:hypothetical protein